MADPPPNAELIDHRIGQLFALVSEALAGATDALLGGEPGTGQAIVDADQKIDELTFAVEEVVWARIESGQMDPSELRRLVSVLLILPELERSADLAEHIAQRAVTNLGSSMSPVIRGIIQRMSEVILEMWRVVADAYVDRTARGIVLDDADEEVDILRDRLLSQVTRETMPSSVTAQVTLLARFYERLGDHAVNLGRRIDRLPTTGATQP